MSPAPITETLTLPAVPHTKKTSTGKYVCGNVFFKGAELWILLGPIAVPDARDPVGENLGISLYVEQNISPGGATNVLLDVVNIRYFIICGEKLGCQASPQDVAKRRPQIGPNHGPRCNRPVGEHADISLYVEQSISRSRI